MGITLEDRRDLVQNLARLSLWFSRQRALAGEALRDVISRRTPLYRLTVLWDGKSAPSPHEPGWGDSRWDRLVDEIEQIHGRHGRRERSDSWEKAGLEALWPVLEPRIRRDVEAWPWIPSCLGTQRPEAGVFGFFLYEWRDTGDGQESLLLHMGNSLAPRSPFEDLGTRANELLRVLDSAEKARPDAKRLVSETWLNSFGAFLRLFPPDWSRNPAAGELGHAFDWWGQFVTRRGSYHKPNGDFLRTTGCFRYPSVSLGCDVQALRRHLEHSFAP